MFKNAAIRCRDLLCCEREIICISNNKISSRKVGAVFVFWNVLFVLWTAFVTISYFDLKRDKEISEYEISKLKAEKINIMSSVKILEKNIDSIQDFVFALNKYDRFSDVVAINSNQKIDDDMDEVRIVLNRTKEKVENVNLAIADRINKIEEISTNLGINNGIQLVSHEEIINSISDFDFLDPEVRESLVLKKTLENNINELSELENFLNVIPLSSPENNYRVSSKFGPRFHPIIKTTKLHSGVDLAGPYLAKIYAPADGVVKFVGTKSGYGKAVIIEHGYDLATVYGHLSSYKVKNGDIVKRGDVIGIQGHSGVATGDHLHYEILQGKTRFDPMEFIELGNAIY